MVVQAGRSLKLPVEQGERARLIWEQLRRGSCAALAGTAEAGGEPESKGTGGSVMGRSLRFRQKIMERLGLTGGSLEAWLYLGDTTAMIMFRVSMFGPEIQASRVRAAKEKPVGRVDDTRAPWVKARALSRAGAGRGTSG